MAFIDRQSSNRVIAVQTVAAGSSSAGATNPFGKETYQVLLVSNTACNVQIGDGSQTASQTTSPFLPANWERYVTVTPGQSIAAIQAATGGLVTATAGTLWVIEVGA